MRDAYDVHRAVKPTMLRSFFHQSAPLPLTTPTLQKIQTMNKFIGERTERMQLVGALTPLILNSMEVICEGSNKYLAVAAELLKTR